MKEVIRTMSLIWHQHKLLLIFLIIINIILGISPLISVFLVQSLINSLSQRLEFFIVILYFSGYITISVLISFFSAIQMYLNGKISNFLSFEIEYKVFDVVSNMKLTDFEDEETYSLIDKLSNEATSKPYSVFSLINSISITMITLVTGYVYLISIKPIYGITLIILTIISVPFLLWMSNRQFSIHWARTESERKAWYMKYLITHDFSAKEIIFFNTQDYLKKEFRKLKRNFILQDIKILRGFSAFNFIYEFITMLVTAILVISVIWSIYLGKVLLGTLTSVTQIITLTQESTQNVINDIFSLKYDLQLLKKLYDFIQKYDGEEKQTDKLKILVSINKLELKNLSYDYNDNRALDNINFSIKKGEMVAVVGSNGSGKSTLVKILSGLYSPTKGNLFFNNVNSNEIDKHTFHNKISVLFQNFVKYELTLKENIGFGDVNNINDDKKIISTLNKYNKSLAGNMYIYDQLGNWFSNGRQLSGGQWQSVATSRAFFNENADLIILDEPNSALDSVAERNLFNEFQKIISKDKIGLFISHRIGAVKHADRILVISKGKLIADGNHDYLINNCDEYKRLEEAERYE